MYEIDILNFQELHVMLGIVQKLLDYIKLLSSTSFIESYLKAIAALAKTLSLFWAMVH